MNRQEFTTPKERATDAAQHLLDAVNEYSFDQKVFAATITNAHRTLQQSAMRAFMACIEDWAAAPSCDGRNVATIALAKRIAALDNRYLPLV